MSLADRAPLRPHRGRSEARAGRGAPSYPVPVRTSRLETFADGVFAIAATLLILNVDAQVTGHGSALGGELLHAWPSYLAYGISFFTIGIIWVNHHTTLNQVAAADRVFLFLNVGFLMCVAFIPFPTRLVAQHLRESGATSAAAAYGLTLLVTALFFNAVWFYAAGRRRLLRPDADPKVVSGVSRSYIPGPAMYLTGTLVALASADAALIIFALITVFYVVESAVFGRSPAPDTT